MRAGDYYEYKKIWIIKKGNSKIKGTDKEQQLSIMLFFLCYILIGWAYEKYRNSKKRNYGYKCRCSC